MSSSAARRLALGTTALALISSLGAPAGAADCTWQGGGGDWANAARWSCNAVPGSGDNATIDGSNAITSTVSVSSSQTIANLSITSGDTLGLSSSLAVYGGAVANAGTIAIGPNGSLYGAASFSITGSGVITFGDVNTGGAYLYAGGANTITITSGQTLVGAGYIGNDSGNIANAGVIDANSTVRPLVLDARTGSGGVNDASGVGGAAYTFANTNTIEATAGGTLQVNSGYYYNAGGAFVASGTDGGSNVSTVFLNNDARVQGGTLTSTDGGQILSSTGNVYLDGVTLTAGSTYNISNSMVQVNNSLTNNGTINIQPNGQLLGISAATSIDGIGTINLGDVNTGGAYLYSNGANVLTVGAGQTIVGAGYYGNDSGNIVNAGVVNANSTVRPLIVDARSGSAGVNDNSGIGGGSNTFYNTGLLEATNGGTLQVNSGYYLNGGSGALLASGTGSTVFLNNDARIVGGTLTSNNGGQILSNTGNQYLDGVTLTSGSTYNIVNDSVQLSNALTNNGTISLGTNASLIGVTAATGITGTGTITLGDIGNGGAYLYGSGANTLTLGSGQTVNGAGFVGADTGNFVNNGVIDATSASYNIHVDARSGSAGINDNSGVGGSAYTFQNNNLMEATGGATLDIRSGDYDNRNGRIVADGTGSTVFLNNDARIVGGTLTSTNGGQILSNTGNQYLDGVTLTSGSTYNIVNDTVHIDNTLTNNGTITLNASTRLVVDTPVGNLVGTGTVVLNDPGSYLYGAGQQLNIGAGQTVRGTGNVGADSGVIGNAGNILADGSITIDAQGGGSGLGGAGLGTNGNAAFYNDNGGKVQAGNGGATVTLNSGLYEQAAGGSFAAGAGSTFTMANDSNLVNLQSGGVLNKGLYLASQNGTMNLRSDQTSAITTIGTNVAGTDTVVSLTGTGSVIEVTPRSGGTTTTIDQSLQSIAQSGELILADGRSFTASNGAFSNAGTLNLQSGSFAAPAGFTNSGTVTGNGSVGSPITNSGTVVADGGTLSTQAITGTTGTVRSNTGGTLDLSGATAASTAGYLVNNGHLSLGTNSVTVTSDYQNANFGSGNAFNRHADVSGTGAINAASATMDLSGTGLNNAANTLNVGNVRLGNSSSTTLTITNNGTETTLRGAVQSPSTNTVSISSSNFVVGPNGGSTSVTLSYTGTAAGQLTGNTITVANNFDNVADRTLTIQGAAYNPASASLSPNPVNLGATRVGGTLSGTVTITNTAPAANGYSEKLAVTSATGGGPVTGTVPAGLINPQSSATSTVSIASAASGNYQGSVIYGLATDGTGTSGLAQQALASQTVQVNGKVYQTANAQLGATTVDFGTVRQGTGSSSGTVSITNTANGALNDSLNTSIGALPTGVTGTAPGALAGGASANATFSHSNAAAGSVSGTGTLNFTSTDPDLQPLQLASQNVAFKGTVTQLAIADLFRNAGAGSFTGSGTSYTLDLGSFSGSGSSSTDLGVLNGNAGASYSETLGGMFSGAAATGYTFNGMTFSGLAGQTSDIGNLLNFNASGLADGTYTDVLTFSGYSRYDGLQDYALAPITVNVTATVTGSGVTGAVPEPATWTMVIIGFGFAGGALRRRRLATLRRSVA